MLRWARRMAGPGPREVGPRSWGRELVVTSIMGSCMLVAREGSAKGRGELVPPSGEPSRLMTSGAGSEGVIPVMTNRWEASIGLTTSAGWGDVSAAESAGALKSCSAEAALGELEASLFCLLAA